MHYFIKIIYTTKIVFYVAPLKKNLLRSDVTAGRYETIMYQNLRSGHVRLTSQCDNIPASRTMTALFNWRMCCMRSGVAVRHNEQYTGNSGFTFLNINIYLYVF